MVSDQQVKRLWRLAPRLSLEVAAAKAGMDPKTGRKYLRARRLPSEMRQKHTWRTRPDPFIDVWDEVEQLLKVEPGLQAKTIFEYLQERQPGRFSEGQVRTLQRRIKHWRALEGPPREVFFAQDHYPGELCQSDFNYREDLFPTSWFRLAYDALREEHGLKRGAKEYLEILALAARRSEALVEETIRVLLGRRDPLNAETVAKLTEQGAPPLLATVEVDPVSLAVFDELLCSEGAAA